MNIAILHFSARENGNCAAIAHQLTLIHKAEECSVFPIAHANFSPCRRCAYECFAQPNACPYATDDVRRIYQAVMEADLAYFILPNYADAPPAVYYAYNERSQCVFQGNEALLNAYLAVPKRFIIVSNHPSPSFNVLPQYHTTEGTSPQLLYLPPRRFCKSSLDGNMMEAAEARELLSDFFSANEKNAVT